MSIRYGPTIPVLIRISDNLSSRITRAISQRRLWPWLTADEPNASRIPGILREELGRHSGNNVGGQLIFNLTDAIAQVELALF